MPRPSIGNYQSNDHQLRYFKTFPRNLVASSFYSSRVQLIFSAVFKSIVDLKLRQQICWCINNRNVQKFEALWLNLMSKFAAALRFYDGSGSLTWVCLLRCCFRSRKSQYFSKIFLSTCISTSRVRSKVQFFASYFRSMFFFVGFTLELCWNGAIKFWKRCFDSWLEMFFRKRNF